MNDKIVKNRDLFNVIFININFDIWQKISKNVQDFYGYKSLQICIAKVLRLAQNFKFSTENNHMFLQSIN